MAAYQFSALSDGQAISFNPGSDVLNFDQTFLSAADVFLATESAGTRVTAAGKNVLLQNTALTQLATSNVTFADGSRLLFGDNSSAQNDGGANSLTGTTGNDLLAGFGGADTLNGGAGNDRFLMTADYGTGDVIDGGTGIDVLYFGQYAQSAVLVNLASATFSGGGAGGTGSGRITNQGIENVVGGAFNDILTGNAAANHLVGLDGNDTFTAREGNDTLIGGAGDDVFNMSNGGTSYGDDFIDGGSGVDAVDFGSNGKSAAVIDLAAGTITGGGPSGAGSATLLSIENAVGTPYADLILGNSSSNFLYGHLGNDTLDGGAANDRLEGAGGADQFRFSVAPGGPNADTIVDFASGLDKIALDRAVHADLGAAGNFAAGDARFRSGAVLNAGQDADDRVIYNTSTGQLWYDADGSGSGAAQLIATLQGAPALTATGIAAYGEGGTTPPPGGATNGDDSLVGTPGNDTIDGLAGDDLLIGGDGVDTVIGGAGTDTEIMESGIAGDGIEILILRGYSEVAGADGHGNELDNRIIDEGPGNAFLYGNGGNDTLIGGNGFNVFVFQGDPAGSSDNYGHDSVDGGGDINWLFFENNGSAVTVDFRAGTVTGGSPLPASVTFTNVERAQGTLFNDVMYAGDAGNWLNGYGGNDTLIGGAGNDELSGDSGFGHPTVDPGDDSLFGGGGNDGLGGEEGNDRLDGGTGNDWLSGGEGMDSFIFTAAPGAANADEIFDFASAGDKIVLDGSVHANAGPSGNFAAGDPRFFSGAGASSGQDATDRVVYDTTTGRLWYDEDGTGAAAAFQIATLQGAPTVTASDIEVVNGSGGGVHLVGTSGNDSLVGGPGNDTINGLGGNDTLVGNAGDDRLDGGLGTDTLNGGDGNDTYIVTSGDVIVADPGGIDTVLSSVSWSLGAATNGLDNLTLTGTAAISGQGNNADNVLIGNDAANTLNGRAGNDTLTGNGGNDIFDISTGGTASYGNDVIDGGVGIDWIDFLGSNAVAAVVVDLAAGTATGGGSLVLAGIENVLGGGFADRISGNSAANTLYGQGGNDTLAGGTGIDTMSGGAGADSFVFAEAAGSTNADRVLDFVPGTDQLLFENGVLTGLGAAGDWAAGDGRFWAAAGATSGHDATDRLVYNTTTGNLYYDADGSDTGASLIVATLQGAPALGATDITVI